MFQPNRCKDKLREGKSVFGLLHSFAHAPLAEMIGQAGYDFVVIDGEHGMGSESENTRCLMAMAATEATGILRIPSTDPGLLPRALDLGAEGVLVPNVRSIDEAAAIAAAKFYPPRGTRGFSAGTIRGADYGQKAGDYVEADGDNVLLCLMIESAEGVDNVAGIAALDGVDVIQVGPFDLSYELGVPGQFEHKDFTDALRKIEEGTKAAGKVLGGVPLPGMDLDRVHELGYRMITLGADAPMLAAAMKGSLEPTQ